MNLRTAATPRERGYLSAPRIPHTGAALTGPSTITCGACGAAAPTAARFCGNCGASLAARRCDHCGAELSNRARFCHRCGRPTMPGTAAGQAGAAGPARSEQTAWIVAAAVVAVLIGAIVWWVERGTPTPVAPDMANPGAGGAAPPAGAASAGAAPDISRMSPRERFDRLFNRVMTAADGGDSTTVARFTPMALGAYAQLDTVDADARYHAALLMLQVGGVPGAVALADSIEKAQPGHLFAYLIRGAAADLAQNDTMRRRAYRDFLQHYPTEERANRPEYREHQPAIEEFRSKAEAEANSGNGKR
jgi:hypothetical protein